MVIPVGSSSLSTKFCFLQQMGISVLTSKKLCTSKEEARICILCEGSTLIYSQPTN